MAVILVMEVSIMIVTIFSDLVLRHWNMDHKLEMFFKFKLFLVMMFLLFGLFGWSVFLIW